MVFITVTVKHFIFADIKFYNFDFPRICAQIRCYFSFISRKLKFDLKKKECQEDQCHLGLNRVIKQFIARTSINYGHIFMLQESKI